MIMHHARFSWVISFKKIIKGMVTQAHGATISGFVWLDKR